MFLETHATWRRNAAVILLALLLGGEIAALGANGAVLAAIASVAEIAIAMIVLLLIAPDTLFWRRAAPVLLLAMAMPIWLLLPVILPDMFRAAPPHPVPDLLLPGLARWMGGLAVLVTGACIGYRRGLMRIALFAILFAGLVTLAIGVVFRQISPDVVWGQSIGILAGRYTGTLLNANSAGCLAGALAMLTIGCLLDNLRRSMMGPNSLPTVLVRVLLLIGLILSLAAVGASGSRAVMALCFVILVVIVAADDLLWRLLRGWTGIIYLVVTAVVVGILALTVGELTFDRLFELRGDSIDRTRIWLAYWEAAKASPWIGYGPLSFDQVTMRQMLDVQTARELWYVHAPHSVILSLLVTGGWPYLLLMTLTGSLMATRIARAGVTKRQDPMLRGLVAALVLILLCAQVDIQLDVPALVSFTVALLALAWGRALRTSPEDALQTG